MRRAVGWLRTHELQRDPPDGHQRETVPEVDGTDGIPWTTAAEWAAALARTLASGDDHFTGGEGDGYAREPSTPRRHKARDDEGRANPTVVRRVRHVNTRASILADLVYRSDETSGVAS